MHNNLRAMAHEYARISHMVPIPEREQYRERRKEIVKQLLSCSVAETAYFVAQVASWIPEPFRCDSLTVLSNQLRRAETDRLCRQMGGHEVDLQGE